MSCTMARLIPRVIAGILGYILASLMLLLITRILGSTMARSMHRVIARMLGFATNSLIPPEIARIMGYTMQVW
jgi:uncharacterized membrane protein